MENASRKPLVLFGCSSLSSLTAYCLTKDAMRTVSAFTVDEAYIHSDTHDGYPVVAFETLVSQYPPDSHELIIPLGNTRINEFRQETCERAKAMGYNLANYVSGSASVWPDLPLGENTIIFEQAIVQSFTRIGDNVILRSGSNIGHHSRVGDHTYVASGVTTGGEVSIGERSWIGLGAVLRDGITIGERCFIGMGAVVTGDTEPDSVYVGVPARRLPNKTSLDVT